MFHIPMSRTDPFPSPDGAILTIAVTGAVAARDWWALGQLWANSFAA